MADDSHRSGSAGLTRRLFIAATAGAAGCASTPTPRAARTAATSAPLVLKFSDHEPLGGMRTRFLKDIVFPAIERESNGRLRIEDRWDGEMAASYDALGAVSGGAADMGTIVPEYAAKQLPLHQIFKSFVRGPVGARQVDFFNRAYAEAPELPAELARNNLTQILFGVGYPVAFFRNAPMADLGDVKGGKWRAANFWHLGYLKNAGAIPVTMPWSPAIPEALKARTLDGLMVNVDSGYMLNVHESAPHVLVSKELWLGQVYILAMNKNVWERLASEDQDAIRRAADKSRESIVALMAESFDAQLADLRRAGASVRILSAPEVRAFETLSRYTKVQARWAQEQQAGGVANAAATISKIAAIIGDFMI